ncbi:MAG: hypothetical protein Ct9H90mP16_02180 [Candidatus Poseidoniales archaeon]|nr:MAG: hypothetical protein Ct9H90mP16_02180 [Candidatus Poseidoniales archaeon]
MPWPQLRLKNSNPSSPKREQIQPGVSTQFLDELHPLIEATTRACSGVTGPNQEFSNIIHRNLGFCSEYEATRDQEIKRISDSIDLPTSPISTMTISYGAAREGLSMLPLHLKSHSRLSNCPFPHTVFQNLPTRTEPILQHHIGAKTSQYDTEFPPASIISKCSGWNLETNNQTTMH